MRKLSIRKRGKKGQGTTAYEVGDPAFTVAVTVTAPNKREALKKAKPLVRKKFSALAVEKIAQRDGVKAANREERRLERTRRESEN